MANTPQSSLKKTLHQVANVEIYDDADGIFGELIHPQLVALALERETADDDLVGQIDDNSRVPPTVALYSQSFTPSDDINDTEQTKIPLEFNDTCNRAVRVRWIDTEGHNPPTHKWTIQSLSTMVQYTQAGHIFLLSTLDNHQSEAEFGLFADDVVEEVLCAYRPIKQLPSKSPHCVLIEQQQQEDDTGRPTFIIESMLMDETKQDALIVAASELDPQTITTSRSRNQKTLVTLKTILSNIPKHPTDKKFRSFGCQTKGFNEIS